MKRTQIKDAIRNIGKKKISFISICIIVLLGVGCFLWAGFVKKSMIGAAETYYREQKFADVEMACSLGISDDEIEQIPSSLFAIWFTIHKQEIREEKAAGGSVSGLKPIMLSKNALTIINSVAVDLQKKE